jgi:NH3-dependent NAD+ synthetase
MPVLDVDALIDERVRAIAHYHQATGITRAELDVSGGVDSACLLALLARAVGAENVTAVYIGIHSGEEFRQRAIEVADAAGVALVDVDATEVFDRLHGDMLAALGAAGFDLGDVNARRQADASVDGSIRSCLRAPIGRGLNRLTGGGIRHGTGNECEDRFVRFYQKGGDGEVDTNPLAMLAKGEIFQIGRGLGVPRSILAAVPSPDLHGIGEAHNDEDELREMTGVHWTYSKVDVDSGAYTYVGTIERMARFLDGTPEVVADVDPDWQALTTRALASTFPEAQFEADAVLAHLKSARHLEASTRHKWNPNCPTLGSREILLEAGLLSDDLPDVG